MTDRLDPSGLLKTLIRHGIVVTPVDGRRDLYTATCPFDEHPATVDTIASHRDTVACHTQAAALFDDVAPGWRTREEWRPAFNIRPIHGSYHCFGCGAHGSATDLATELEQRQEAW